MAKLLGLTPDQAKRVGRVVRERETSGPAHANKTTSGRKTTPEIYAELTGEGTAGHYSWKMKFPKGPPDGTFIDASPAYVVADFTARELNLIAGLTGKIVKLTFIGYDAAGKGSYEFNAGGGKGTTLVKVTGNAAGGGKYTGVVWDQPTATTIPNAGNLSEAEIGQTGDAVLILNAAEVGRSTHDLTAGAPKVTIFPAHLSTAKSDDATPLPVYTITAIDWEACV